MQPASSAGGGLSEWLEQLLPGVVRPARYTGNEWNSTVKEWAGRLHVCLVWPGVYEDGVCDPWLQALYADINSRDDMLCERAFVPWPDMDEALRAAAVPLYALESRRPLTDFDVILMALPEELSAPAVLTVRELASARPPATMPPVVAIGPGAANPAPLGGCADACLLGDVDSSAVRQTVEALRAPQRDWPVWLCAAGAGEASGAAPRRGPLLPLPARPIVPFVEARRGRVAVDLSCPPFYAWSGGPWRERPLDEILAAVASMLSATGYDHVQLSGPHSELAEIVDRLSARYRDARLHIALDSPIVSTRLIELIDRLPHTTRGPLTIDMAHTAGDSLFETARLAYKRGWHVIRLLVCPGMPGETMSDIETVAEAARRVRDIGREEINGRAQVQVIATPFVPRRHGPHAAAPLVAGDDWQQRVNALTRGVRGPGLRLQWRGLESRLTTAALARGDRRMGAVIDTAWRGGMRRPDVAQDAAAWQAAAAAAGVDLLAQAGGG